MSRPGTAPRRGGVESVRAFVSRVTGLESHAELVAAKYTTLTDLEAATGPDLAATGLPSTAGTELLREISKVVMERGSLTASPIPIGPAPPEQSWPIVIQQLREELQQWKCRVETLEAKVEALESGKGPEKKILKVEVPVEQQRGVTRDGGGAADATSNRLADGLLQQEPRPVLDVVLRPRDHTTLDNFLDNLPPHYNKQSVECMRRAANLRVQNGHCPIDAEHIRALYMYSYELRETEDGEEIPGVSLPHQIYRDMNTAMRTSENVEAWQGFIALVHDALHAVEATKCRVYRGIGISVDLDMYEVGKTVLWPAFSSSSYDRSVAKVFIDQSKKNDDDPGTLFAIKAERCRSIDQYSHIPAEKELLFPPNSWFKVMSHVAGAELFFGCHVIELAEVVTGCIKTWNVGRVERMEAWNRLLFAGVAAAPYLWWFDPYAEDPRFQPVTGAHTNTVFGFVLWDNHLLSGSADKLIHMWTMEEVGEFKKVLTFTGHDNWVQGMFQSGRRLYSVDHGGTLKYWNRNGRCEVTVKAHEGEAFAVVVHEGMCYTGGQDYLIKCWDEEGVLKRTLKGQGHWVKALHLYNGFLFSGGALATGIMSWSLTDMENNEPVAKWAGNHADTNALSTIGEYLLSASDDKTIKVWDRDGKVINTLHHEMRVMSISVLDGLFYSGGEEAKVRQWVVDLRERG